MTNSIKIILLGLGLVLVAHTSVFAQDATEAVATDENIQASDLGIGEPSILPDNPLYFLKNWGRGIQGLFTFNSVAKSELKEKFASEKLMELKKTIEQKKNAEVIKKATENYQKGVEEMKKTTEAIKQKTKESPEVDKFLNKFVSQQALHQKLLQKLEEQVPSEAFEKIKEARETHLERFQEVMLKLEDRKEKITEKLDKILEEQKGSQFKNFKNLEVLKNLEEKVPEQAKEAIQKAEENALKRLQGDLEKMSPEDQEKFKEYTEKISGAKEKQLEILENLKAKIKEAPKTPESTKLQEKLERGKAKILEKIEEKLEKLDCPLWILPAPVFCKEGRVIVEKNPETGCPLPPKCIIPGEAGIPEKPEKPTCVTLWNPVCGKDGKTYFNSCFAKAAWMEIDYEGVCRVKCPEIKCVWDPCPGEHLPDQNGCINCASPCRSPAGVKPPSGGQKVCIQVITPAISPEGICKEFTTPCNVPVGWRIIDKCPVP